MAVPQRYQGWLGCAQPPVTVSEEGNTISNPPKYPYLAFSIILAGPLLQILDCSACAKGDGTGGRGKGIITLLIQAGHWHLSGHGSLGRASANAGGSEARLGSVGQADAALWRTKALIGLANCREGQIRPVG